MEAEQLWKERDDLLRAIEELRSRTELAHQERANAQWRASHLKKELWRERDLKVVAEGVSAGLSMEIGQHQEEVRRLEAEVTWQRDEVRKLRANVNGKSLVSLVIFLPGTRGKPFDTVGM